MLFQAEQPIVRLPDGKFQAVEQKNVAGSEHWWHTWRKRHLLTLSRTIIISASQ